MAIEVQKWLGKPHTFLYEPPKVPEIIKAIEITDKIPHGKNGNRLRIIFWSVSFGHRILRFCCYRKI